MYNTFPVHADKELFTESALPFLAARCTTRRISDSPDIQQSAKLRERDGEREDSRETWNWGKQGKTEAVTGMD